MQRGRSSMGNSGGKLLIVGAGGHGKVVADAAACMGAWKEIVFVDKKYPDMTVNGRWPLVGNHNDLRDLRKRFTQVAVAVGNAVTRLQLLDELKSQGFELPVIRHPSS